MRCGILHTLFASSLESEGIQISWQECKKESLHRILLLGFPAPPVRLDGLIVTLLDFESREIAGFLVGGYSAEFQQNVNRAVKRELERRGAIVKLKRITIAESIRWAQNGT